MPPPDPTPQEAAAAEAAGCEPAGSARAERERAERERADRERAAHARRLAWRVDVVLCVLVALPVISILAGSGDAFLLSSFFLPVGVMLVCAVENHATGGAPSVPDAQKM